MPVADIDLVTLSLDVRSTEDRDRLLTALRDLIRAGGPDAAVVLTGHAAPPRWRPDAAPRGLTTAAAPADEAVIRPGTRTVVHDGTPVPLSRLEYDLLLFLVRHPERVFTRQQLLTYVWGHTYAGSRTVDVHVRRLRMKLDLGRPLVTTVHGIGYRLADDPPVRVAGG